MRVKITKLLKKIKQYERVVLYGAGTVAELVLEELKEQCVQPEFCVVSQKIQGKILVNIVPVYSLDECEKELKANNTIVIVAVTNLYQKEIEDILLQRGILNYICFIDYLGDDISVYRNMTQEEYLDEVAEWYIDEHQLPMEEKETIVQKLWVAIKKECVANKILLFVGNLSPRVIKIAKALQKKGYIVETLCYLNDGIKKIFLKKLEDNSDSFFLCNIIEQVLYYLICSDAKLVHIFSHMYMSELVHVLLDGKELFPKIIFEQYDIANEMYPFTEKKVLEEERYCLENVERLVCRGYEQEYLINEMGYKISGKIVNFFDYCDDGEITNKIEGKKNTLSLCYAGGLATEDEWPDVSYFCLLEYARVCELNKCDLHVYPTQWDERRFAKYIALAGKNNYFHFHKPVQYDHLMEELSQYDYGIGLLFRRSLAGKKIDGYYTREKLVYAACNHFYDYLDAGLPIISAVPVKLSQYLKEKGVLLDWALEDYDFQELKNRRAELGQKVASVQEELQVSNHIERLVEFYESIVPYKENEYAKQE